MTYRQLNPATGQMEERAAPSNWVPCDGCGVTKVALDPANWSAHKRRRNLCVSCSLKPKRNRNTQGRNS